MRARAILLVASAGIWFAQAPAVADHCNGAIRSLSASGGAVTVYMDDREATAGGVWWYLESNGVVGLQTGGSSVVLGRLDPCAHDNPDTLLL